MRLTLPLLFLLACPPSSVETGETDDTADDTAALPCEQRDDDADGVSACEDCDDEDAGVGPSAPERCNGLDDDCDGLPHPSEADNDSDGRPDCEGCASQGWWELVRDEAGADAILSRLRADLAGSACDDYRIAREAMFLDFDKVNGQVECVYTGTRVSVGTSLPDSNVMNTEHSWPQSLGAENEPAKCDLAHLFPVTASSNTQRSNHPYGLVARDVSWQEGGSRLGESSDGRTVFEPRPAHRGDVARAMYYFALRYDSEIASGTRSSFWNPQKAILAQWHQQDPPNAAERARAAAIAEEQGRANPFVVCPSLLPIVQDRL
jgi:hypothetical protein